MSHPINTQTTRNINAVKGFAVLSVLVNHYLNGYVSGDQGGFANGFIGLFFLVGGFLTCSSLYKRLPSGFNVPSVLKFYLGRAFRIYPLFFVCVVIERFVVKSEIGLLQAFGINSPGVFWFISALIQCYVLSVALFMLVRNRSFLQSSLLCLLLYSAVVFIYYLLDWDYFFGWFFVYRHVPGGHMLLFMIGMFVFRYQEKISLVFNQSMLAVAFLFFASIYLTRLTFEFGSIFNIGIGVLFILCSSLFFVRSIGLSHNSKIYEWLALVGIHSYGLYLFHLYFYEILTQFGLIKNDCLPSVALVVVSFPVFLFFCVNVERMFNYVSSAAYRLTEKAVDALS